ncbi:MAG: DUF1559 domain-containing protein, partial [Thermoguttaceae bacterium]|nr:DUF1559 domain-containing protein [Thermoguttaceae bacterium]
MVCPSRRSSPASIEYQRAGNGGSSVGPCSDYCPIASTDSNTTQSGRAPSDGNADHHYYVRVTQIFTENCQTYQKGFFRGAKITGNSEGTTKSEPRDTFSRCVDGLSNQIVVGEKHIPIDGINICKTDAADHAGWCQCHDCSYLCAAAATSCGYVWRCVATYWSADHRTPYTLLVNGIDGPYDDKVSDNAASINCGLGSWHASGANFLKGDGSVTFMSSTTPQSILGYLATVDDGNTQGN